MLLLVSPGTIHRRAPSFDVSGTSAVALFSPRSRTGFCGKIRSCFAAAERPAPNHCSAPSGCANPTPVLASIQPVVILVLFWPVGTLDILLHSPGLKCQETPQSSGGARLACAAGVHH